MPMAFRSRPAVRSNRPLGSTGSVGTACTHRSKVHLRARLELCCNKAQAANSRHAALAMSAGEAMILAAPSMTVDHFLHIRVSSSFPHVALVPNGTYTLELGLHTSCSRFISNTGRKQLAHLL